MSSSSRTTYETDYETVTKRVRRGLGGWWWLALLAIPLLLAAAAALLTRGGIEDDLKADATKALDKAGITNAKVDFDGRDGTVTLPAGADKSVAKKAVEGVDGVRAAEIKGGGVAAPAPTTPAETPTTQAPSETPSATETPTPSATAAETGPFSVTTTGDEVIVEGVVPDEATKKAVVDAATKGAAGKKVTDKVTVTAGSPKVDAAQVTGALGVLTAAGADGNKVAYDGKGGVTLTGEVADEAAKTKQGDEATKLFPQATVTNNLTFKAAGTADCAALNTTIAGLLKGNNPTFADNSTALLAASHPTLDKVAAAIKACPDAKIAVSGHTDNTGNAPRNQRLSQGRATAVRSYLVSKGAAANNITAKGFGQTKPIASNSDAAGRDANRRVEITVGG